MDIVRDMLYVVCCILFCDTCGDVTAEHDAGCSNQMKATLNIPEDGLLLGPNA